MTTAIEERNIHSVREQARRLNARDIEGFLQFLAPSFVWRSDLIPIPHQGIEAARQGLHQIFTIFPDIYFDEVAIYPGGEAVTGIFEVGGTRIDPGPSSILPPVQDHPWHMNQAIIHTFDSEGRLLLVWLFANVAALMQQLGVFPQNLDILPGRRMGNALGARGFDPWNPNGSNLGSYDYSDPRFPAATPILDPHLVGTERPSMLYGFLALPLRFLLALLTAPLIGLAGGRGALPGSAHLGSHESGCLGCGGH